MESSEKRERTQREYMRQLEEALEQSFLICPVRHRTANEENRRLDMMVTIIKQAATKGHHSKQVMPKLAPILCRQLDGQNAWFDGGKMWVEADSGLVHAVNEEDE